MKSKASIQTFENIDELSNSAKHAFIKIANEAIQQRGQFLIALSGGSTPIKLFEKLAQENLNWVRMHFFWADERCVPVGDDENNYGQVKKILFDRIKIPEGNIHRIPSDLRPADAADQYSLTLKKFADIPLDWPRFDLVLLGMGDDGHTASLFPGSPIDVTRPTLAVTANYQGRPANRVTLTQNVFNSARNIIFLVAGASKAETLLNVLRGEHKPDLYPAQRINPSNGYLTWLVDEKAGRLL